MVTSTPTSASTGRHLDRRRRLERSANRRTDDVDTTREPGTVGASGSVGEVAEDDGDGLLRAGAGAAEPRRGCSRGVVTAGGSSGL
jgi:hypothetical protein